MDQEQKKPSLLVRLFVPKRFHKYLTPEVFVAWNVSSWVTILQVTLLQKYWPWLVAKIFIPALAALKVAGKEIQLLSKSAVDVIF